MKAATRTHYRQLVLDAVGAVRAGLDEALDVTAMGRRAGMAPLHFHRIFRGMMGETALAMHRRLRLERAAGALLEADRAVTRVAFDAGYETHESFTRAFGEAFGASPTEFRERTRANPVQWAAANACVLAARSGVHFGAEGEVLQIATEEVEMDVRIAEMDEKRVVACPHRGPYSDIASAFAQLDTLLREGSVRADACVEMVAIQYDDPDEVPAAELRADAGVVVRGEVAVPPGLRLVRIPAGTYACAVHEGPYDRLGDAWARFMGQWLPGSGRALASGPTYERYLNTPMTAAPHELRTEMYLPLEGDVEG